LFSTFDRDKNNYLDLNEFATGMITLFNEINFDKLISFIFDFYDMDKDSLIMQEDIKLVLSYLPLTIVSSKPKIKDLIKLEKYEYNN